MSGEEFAGRSGHGNASFECHGFDLSPGNDFERHDPASAARDRFLQDAIVIDNSENRPIVIINGDRPSNDPAFKHLHNLALDGADIVASAIETGLDVRDLFSSAWSNAHRQYGEAMRDYEEGGGGYSEATVGYGEGGGYAGASRGYEESTDDFGITDSMKYEPSVGRHRDPDGPYFAVTANSNAGSDAEDIGYSARPQEWEQDRLRRQT